MCRMAMLNSIPAAKQLLRLMHIPLQHPFLPFFFWLFMKLEYGKKTNKLASRRKKITKI